MRETLLKELGPQVLAVLLRRVRDFTLAEDAVQEALIEGALQWKAQGLPEHPRAWLLQVAQRRLADIDADLEMRNNEEIQRLRACMSDRDTVAFDQDYDALFGGLLAYNPRNRMAFEYRMAAYLLSQQVDKVAAPIEREYRSLIGELRQRNAVGVVVAVRGRIIWSDLFASPALLERYWPKLVRSYAAEALVPVGGGKIDVGAAQNFLLDMNGRREVSETEPGIFRHSEITGDGYKVFELTSLLPKTGFEVHIAKMAE